MSSPVPPFSIVLRFPDVKLGRSKLEEALGMPLDRFEVARKGVFNYAQINIPEDGDVWIHLTRLADRLGPAVAGLLVCNDIGEPCVDIAMHFYDDKFSTSLQLPSIVAERLGHWGFAIEVSVYRTGVD